MAIYRRKHFSTKYLNSEQEVPLKMNLTEIIFSKLWRSILSPRQFIKNRVASFKGRVVFFRTYLDARLFLKKNPEIFTNSEILISWHCSFGHPILGIDATARLYHPNRISLINIHHPRNNKYLPLCFSHSMDLFEFKGKVSPLSGSDDEIRYKAVRAATLQEIKFKSRHNVLSLWQAHNTLGMSDGTLKTTSSKGLRAYHDVMGIDRLWQLGIGKAPCLPQALKEQCIQTINNKLPKFLERPFVVLSLREKTRVPGRDKSIPLIETDDLRDSGPQDTYREAVKYLVKAGYNILGMGETLPEIFDDIPGFYTHDSFGLPWDLLNIYALTQCAILISSHSGPIFLSESVGAKLILCNAYPLTTGSHAASSEILFKHIYDKKLKRNLTYREIYEGTEPPAFWAQLRSDQYEIHNNSSQEILSCVKQGVESLQGTLHFTNKDLALQNAFRSLPNKEMPLFYQKNCPPVELLRQQPDLLKTHHA